MFRLCLAASLAATLVSVCSGQSGTKQEQPPNIVIIFVDDLGYADIGPFGDTVYPTPNLDAMAAGGRTFTDFVASSAVCSASRAALLTGCNHTRLGISGALVPRSNEGLNPDEMTLAECVKQKGYATACFGKWHLGHHKKFGSFGNLVVSCCPRCSSSNPVDAQSSGLFLCPANEGGATTRVGRTIESRRDWCWVSAFSHRVANRISGPAVRPFTTRFDLTARPLALGIIWQ